MPFAPLHSEQTDTEIGQLKLRSGRNRVVKAACIFDRQDDSRLDCLIRNISSGGAKLHFPLEIDLPKTFWLQFYPDNIEVECELVWTCGVQVGVRFLCEFQPVQRVKNRLARGM
jgi:hypothetical protein